jgi:hypothetical protein
MCLTQNGDCLQNNPSNSIERLVVNEKGKPEWTAVLEGLDRLDRDKPEQIANWYVLWAHVCVVCRQACLFVHICVHCCTKGRVMRVIHHLVVSLATQVGTCSFPPPSLSLTHTVWLLLQGCCDLHPWIVAKGNGRRDNSSHEILPNDSQPAGSSRI